MRTRSHIRQFSAVLLALSLGACAAPQPPVETPTPLPTETPTPTETAVPVPAGYAPYTVQSGDTLTVIAARFDTDVASIIYAPNALVNGHPAPGATIYLPQLTVETTPAEKLFPDAAVVFSPEAVGFDVQAYAEEQGGYLAESTELMTRGTTYASEVIEAVALEHSINPRILLALIELESGWVAGFPKDRDQALYPLGYVRKDRAGIYAQVGWAVRYLSEGYYGWRSGTLTEISFPDGTNLRLSTHLNAGTVAVLNFLAQTHAREAWEELAFGQRGILDVYLDLFGDPWENIGALDPLFPTGIEQPELNLPLPVNERWNLTGGPHSAWGRHGPRAALDFAPPIAQPGCGNSTHWTTASAEGRVVRVGNGVVVLDLDMDGYEQTGWVLVYMHVANSDRVALDTYVEEDGIIGHPSCEGGSASGIHVHLARKYNGEWVLADGRYPFVLSGYEARNSERPCDYAYYGFCEGTLDNGQMIVTADPYGNFWTTIYRPESDMEYIYTPTPWTN